MPSYTHPQNDPFLKNLHYAMEYSGGKPAIRIAGGGGGAGSGEVSITGSLPAGTNTIGSVNIANWVDGEITATEFRAKNSFTGASAGDIIALISSFDITAIPPSSEVTLAINVSTMTLLDAVPDLADLVKLGEESYSMEYQYDSNDNLTNEIRTLGEISQERVYSYDLNENLISRTSWTNV